MTEPVPAPVRELLAEGSFCHVATSTRYGPHVTPMVFAEAGDRVWVTTSRRSVKAMAWARDPRVGGLVRVGERAAIFAGTAATYDLLDPESWGRSFRESPVIALAAARYTKKNARFFAGYAVDADHVPLAWTPPGRVFAELRIERSATIVGDEIASAWGEWDDSTDGVERFRVPKAGSGLFDAIEPEIREGLGSAGAGALAVSTEDGPVVLPAAWVLDGPGVYAVLHAEALSLAGSGPVAPAALCVDRPSSWRAREMVGAMVRGRGRIAVPGALESGERSVQRLARAAGADPSTSVVVGIEPERLVWWRGWDSGTVTLR
ncbi:MAG TPA: pyridoxamine 5'-phosphate oxidase family protein [Actinomycetota bacterium]|nr:pyridoxamine 5'-phosphate oxidase family protein [Actinomycetota bacterium]